MDTKERTIMQEVTHGGSTACVETRHALAVAADLHAYRRVAYIGGHDPRVAVKQTDRQTVMYGLVTAPPTTFGYMWLWRSELSVVGDLTLDARLDRVPGSR